ncbi:Uncharacterised protein [Mycobacteroides abscessus subsp. abscessus]|nr:Uncharacterised protein [Mycobacteroides abscessus subsp. abscessus]
MFRDAFVVEEHARHRGLTVTRDRQQVMIPDEIAHLVRRDMQACCDVVE